MKFTLKANKTVRHARAGQLYQSRIYAYAEDVCASVMLLLRDLSK